MTVETWEWLYGEPTSSAWASREVDDAHRFDGCGRESSTLPPRPGHAARSCVDVRLVEGDEMFVRPYPERLS
jgi:hypothetical protein